MSLTPPLVLPNVFVNGTVADANQVDANFNAVVAALNSNSRGILAAPMSFYVSASGVDAAGNGLSPASPAATIQYIIGLLDNNFDFSGQTVTIFVASGSYVQSTVIAGLFLGQNTPSNLTITPLSGTVTLDGDPPFKVTNGAAVLLSGLTLTSSISQCIISEESANVAISGLTFSTAVGAHMLAVRTGTIKTQGNYSITGGGQNHAKANGGQIYIEAPPGNYMGFPSGIPTVTLSGTPAFSSAFALCTHNGGIVSRAAYVGGATGVRYDVETNGVIETNGAGATYLPGSVAGTTATGGIYA
jgi:hypothetical protein